MIDLSHIIERKIINDKTNLDKCFEEGLIPDNIITRQFSGNLNKKLDINDYRLALKNLKEKINLIFNFDNSASLINYIISIYDLPNVIFQNQQITKKNYIDKNQENINLIKSFNKYDIELYKIIKEDNLFFNPPKNAINRKKNKTLFWPQNDPVYGSNKILLNKDFNEIINDLKKNYILEHN